MFFGKTHIHAATMHIWLRWLCNVVRPYKIMQYVCFHFFKPSFVIECTRTKVVKRRKKVSGV